MVPAAAAAARWPPPAPMRNAGLDKRLRVLAAAELFKTTGNTTYRTYFDTWVKDPST